MKKVLRKLPLILVLAALAAGMVYAFKPKPIAVDMTKVERGELIVTVDQDGKTRIKDRYVVAAPLAGRLQRITLKPGDPATSPLAILEPAKPMLLDERTRAEAMTRVNAAESKLRKAKTELDRAVIAENFARAEHERQKGIGAAASKQELASAENREETAIRERKAAEFGVEVADFELMLAQVSFGIDLGLSQRIADFLTLVLHQMLHDYSNGFTVTEVEPWRFLIPTPVKGARVLKVHQESETVVAAGAPLLEIGDPEKLEAVIDVLSNDAVEISKRCTRIELVNWGAKKSKLEGTGWLIEPSGFMKPSALGVEEQRVNVIVDFKIPENHKGAIGENYRVEARFVTWEGKNVLKVKRGAVFSTADGDAVYVNVGGKAVKRMVTIGEKNSVEAQIKDGLEEGDEVVLHPGDRIKDGVLITPREKE